MHDANQFPRLKPVRWWTLVLLGKKQRQASTLEPPIRKIGCAGFHKVIY